MTYHKYNARRTTYHGYNFDSKAESDRYKELELLEQAGVIKDLRIHPTFELQKPFVDFSGKRQRAIVYEADFSYVEIGNPLPIVEDVKGKETAVWLVKKKMFMYHYPQYELRVTK